MDPQAAIDLFNSPGTCRAERAEIADGLADWLKRGGFKPEGHFDPALVLSLRDHGEPAWESALWVNRQLGAHFKINALFPEERLKPCDHPSGFAWNGKVPCTGTRTCHLCGAHQ